MNDCTVWDNSHIFKDLNDPAINELLETSKSDVSNIQELMESFKQTQSIEIVQDVLKLRRELVIELSQLATYLSSITSVDSKDEDALKLQSKLSIIWSDIFKATKPIDTFLMQCSDQDIEKVLSDEDCKEHEFLIKHSRLNKDFTLSDEEEGILAGFRSHGIDAWGKLYNAISGNMTCEVNGEQVGYANAAANLRGSDPALREASWRAIQKSWTEAEQSAAAILNGINGWRNEDMKTRSQRAGRELHALDVATHSARISRQTLDALMETTYKNRLTGQKALTAMAKSRSQEKANPWDLLASPPVKEGESTPYTFTEGMEMIIQAFNSFSSEMGEFAKMMWDKNWIDAKPTPARKPGAYCTKFAKLREPRVFMTYNGSMGDIMTLAHELGHAYHNWVMRDMPYSKTMYPMTLAETASIFAETLVRDYLFENAKTDKERFEICWEDASSAEAMLCNIPSRYEFEKLLVDKRKEGELSANELKDLMKDAWQTWYEDSLTEYDEMFWASKLHFSISGLSFYNYPYLFGYLFSLGIYAQKDKMGDKFVELYNGILRDTGSMTAEDLIKKHLGKNIEEAEFWQDSLDIVAKAVNRFESL
ncbi:M3 family oligoendopeptidase [Bacteriovorax sp. DB6_IX]|uniref:M3 family oligoendopeptidase n=1 Tax=Bacteriovorax sp. DB6_IX TaxID=1353530 RepID=UPI00038A5082|nr:M3 family oligoendopeptidase [Bacteriovorax sp. DB6_IX]EQC50759.1 oligoendopeptidase, pepF/M3 family [Bacteriovorax sp. DB6_IX]